MPDENEIEVLRRENRALKAALARWDRALQFETVRDALMQLSTADDFDVIGRCRTCGGAATGLAVEASTEREDESTDG